MVEQNSFTQRLKELKKTGPRWLLLVGAMSSIFLGQDSAQKTAEPRVPSRLGHILSGDQQITEQQLADTPTTPGQIPLDNNLYVSSQPYWNTDRPPTVEPTNSQTGFDRRPVLIPPLISQSETVPSSHITEPGQPDPGLDPLSGVVETESDPAETLLIKEAQQHLEAVLDELEMVQNQLIQMARPFDLTTLQEAVTGNGIWEDNLAGGFRYLTADLVLTIPAPDAERARIVIDGPGIQGRGEISITSEFVFSVNLRFGNDLLTVNYDQGQVRPTVKNAMPRQMYLAIFKVLNRIESFLGSVIWHPTRM